MSMPDIDLDLVRCFVTVVESSGFTQASKRLHLTQSAITLKIKRLEDMLGQRLFVKTVPPLRPISLSRSGCSGEPIFNYRTGGERICITSRTR